MKKFQDNDLVKHGELVPARGSGMPDLPPNALRFYSQYEPQADQDPGHREFPVRDMLYMLFRYKWKIIFSFLLLTIISTLYVTRVPDTYRSRGLDDR